jgi:hypothetical protein
MPVDKPASGAAEVAVGAPPATAPAGGDAAAGTQTPPTASSATTTVVADRSSGRTLRITGLSVAGGGVVLGVAGFFVRGVATSKLDAIADDAVNNRPYDESNGNWQTFDRAGVAMMIAGGAAVAAGAALYLFNLAPSSSETSVAFTPSADGGGTMTLFGRF